MRRYFLLIFSLMTAVQMGFSQDQVNITGRISDMSKEPVPYVHIINIAEKKGTYSNIHGEFDIKVNKGDTLVFSAIGYARHMMLITHDLKEVHLNIVLKEEAMELKPASVFAYRDLSSLKRAIVDMEVTTSGDDNILIELPTPEVTKGSGGFVVNGAITGLINNLGLNKEYNEQKKLNKFIQADKRKKLASEKYNAKIVNEWTGLEQEELTSFMEFCKLSDEFVLDASTYEVAVAVNQCLDEFNLQQD